MNRLDLWTDSSDLVSETKSSGPAAAGHSSPAPSTASSPSAAGHYHLFTPLHYEPNYAYPLVIWLPDAGGTAREISRVMPLISMRNYAGVGVNGIRPVQAFQPQRGYQWGQQPADLDRAREAVMRAIDGASQRMHVGRHRIFLAGHGTGGTLALRLGLAHPEIFAGAISLLGGLPRGNRPLVRLAHARQVPLLMIYGRDSERYGTDHVCQDLRTMHAAGLKVSLRQYPCGQEVTTKMLSDVNAWIMAIVTGSPLESLQDDPCWESRN